LVCGSEVGIGESIAAEDWSKLQGTGAVPSLFGVNAVGGSIFHQESPRDCGLKGSLFQGLGYGKKKSVCDEIEKNTC
jgi:hypothetical protein